MCIYFSLYIYSCLISLSSPNYESFSQVHVHDLARFYTYNILSLKIKEPASASPSIKKTTLPLLPPPPQMYCITTKKPKQTKQTNEQSNIFKIINCFIFDSMHSNLTLFHPFPPLGYLKHCLLRLGTSRLEHNIQQLPRVLMWPLDSFQETSCSRE